MSDRPPLMTKRRTFLVLVAVGMMDMFLIGRLVSIQAGEGPRLKRLADDIHYRGVPLAPYRGNIVDRNGRLLAGSHHVYSLYAVPLATGREREATAQRLSAMLHLDPATVLRRLSRRQGFAWIKRRLTPNEVEALRAVLPSLPGVYLLTEMGRYYPQGMLAGPVLGYTGIDNQGLAGVELAYNRALTGKPGQLEEVYDVTGSRAVPATQRVVPSVQGNTLELSLDENIQWMAERAAEEAMLNTGARSVSIVAMEPDTGGILALAQRPSLDPNHFRDFPPQNGRLWAVSDAIPPGSIFKPVTLAAALESGATHPGAGFFCPGFKVVLKRRVNCWRPGGHGPETLRNVVENSCNVGFMDLGLALGIDRFYEYLARFGLTAVPKVDLPGAARGIFPSPRRATLLDLAVMAFGQTLTVTPLALLSAISAIANGGELLVPHVARRILTPEGQVVEDIGRRLVRRVVRPEVAQLVQSMMAGVVARGTGKQAQVPGYQVAGKTGTAQKVVGGRVQKGVYIASFVGFAPVPNPRVAMLVSVDEPKGAFYGGQVAAPVFARVLRDLLAYWKVPPTEPTPRPKPGEAAMVPNLVDLAPAEAERQAQVAGFGVRFSGRGEWVVSQSVEYGAWRPAGETIALELGPKPRIYLEWVTVPDFRGLSASQARHLAFDLGINVRARGNPAGTVVAQTLSAGRAVRAGSTVGVWLR
ncbi:MAG: PASTA domain-containing protein [Firmicutes bacterium]|nr:PASTA domain-containing protein [Alicyclobacillaceae bacterium]MCL6497788.1 PASTA domain-containing protein [Bacillota bacterium]